MFALPRWPAAAVHALPAAYDVCRDRLYGHVKQHKRRVDFLAFCRYLRQPSPTRVRLHLILDDFSPDKGDAVCAWAEAKNVEPADAVLRLVAEPHRAQFKALRYFCLNGTDHPDHATQARLIRRYVHWRNRHIYDPRLRHIIRRANTANVAWHSTRSGCRQH